MQFLYIDESGSTTVKHSNDFPYFVISIVHVTKCKALKNCIKSFISTHIEDLKECDTNKKMFKNDKFYELKGSALSKDLKIELAYYLAKRDLFEVYIIEVDNRQVNEIIYQNTACAFNYFLDLCMEYNLRNGNLPNDAYSIQIDERNVKTGAKKSLDDYLRTELILKNALIQDVNVLYFDSANNSLIQLSDFFSNLYYSYLMSSNYNEVIEMLKEKKILKVIYKYPERCIKNE